MHKKILIVDDDPGICNSLSNILREEGYYVDGVTDSAKAAMLIEKDVYDICLFDYKMDGLNGMDLLKMEKEKNPRSAVFILSGILDPDKVFNSKKNTGLAYGIISKPFDVDELLRKISTVV